MGRVPVQRDAGYLHGRALGDARHRSIPDSGVDPRMIITSPSQLCEQNPYFVAEFDRIPRVSREYVHCRRILHK